MSGGDPSWSAGELADSIRDGEIDSNIAAVMADDGDLADLLLYMEDIMDDPGESDTYNSISKKAQTETLRNARMTGDTSTMSAATGISGEETVDASAFGLLDVVEDLYRPTDRDHMANLVVYAPPPPEGPTGVGKTDFAYTVIEGAKRLHRDFSVASNNTSDPFVDVQSWTGLEDWLAGTDGTKTFLFDEASQVLQFADMSAGKALSNLIKLLRKHNCHLIVIGHTGRDIPKDIRRMVMFAQKSAKKTATIGAGLEEGDAGWMNIKNEIHHVENIPATSIEYSSTGDEGDFVFDKDSDGGPDEPEDDAPDRVKCRGSKSGGEGCSSLTEHESGYCDWHRDQWDESEEGADPRFQN